MPQVIEGVTYFTQDEVNGLVGTARVEGRTNRDKEFLRDLGVESIDAAKASIKLSTEQGTQITQLNGQLETARTETATVTGKYQTLSLERAAEAVGAEFKLTPVKSKQVLVLLGL